jgi:hypothetical protein
MSILLSIYALGLTTLHYTYLAGATHPSFSDLPVILPGMINRLTGLKIPDRDVLDLSVRVVEAFLTGGGSVEAARKQADGERTWDDPVPVKHDESIENTPGHMAESRHTKKMEKKERGKILWCDFPVGEEV